MSQNERNAALDIGEPISSMRIPLRGIIPPSIHNISDSDCRGTKRKLDQARFNASRDYSLYTIINSKSFPIIELVDIAKPKKKTKNRFTKLFEIVFLFFSPAARRNRQRVVILILNRDPLIAPTVANFSRAYRRVTRDKE